MKHIKYTLMLTTLLGLSAFAAGSAQAETNTESSQNPQYKTVTTLVGYEEKTIGNIIIEGSGTDETQIPKNIDPASAFDLLDKDKDQMLSKMEMFGKTPSRMTTKKRSNLVTKSGRPIKVDYYMRKNSPSTVRVEDLTQNGTMFEQMDMNKDQFISREEFRFDVADAIKEGDISPAAGMDDTETPQ